MVCEMNATSCREHEQLLYSETNFDDSCDVHIYLHRFISRQCCIGFYVHHIIEPTEQLSTCLLYILLCILSVYTNRARPGYLDQIGHIQPEGFIYDEIFSRCFVLDSQNNSTHNEVCCHTCNETVIEERSPLIVSLDQSNLQPLSAWSAISMWRSSMQYVGAFRAAWANPHMLISGQAGGEGLAASQTGFGLPTYCYQTSLNLHQLSSTMQASVLASLDWLHFLHASFNIGCSRELLCGSVLHQHVDIGQS